MINFEFSEQQEDYLEEFLHKVSRSFAIVIPCLENPLDMMIATAYLLCRVADNIEDSWQPFAWKKDRFAEFYQLLEQPSLAYEILADWTNQCWLGLKPSEISLMNLEQGLMLWKIYSQFPQEVASIIYFWVSKLAEGMEYTLSPENSMIILRKNIRVLAKRKDFDRYCYFVAGTVGHLGTELAILHYRFEPQIAESLIAYSENCGRALQKTNIIKDFPTDLARGFCFIPDEWIQEVSGLPLLLEGAPSLWQYKVMSDVLAELGGAVNYIIHTPYSAVGLRQFSLRSLLTAYQTLLLSSQQNSLLFTPDHNIKISRSCMLQCIEDAKSMAEDNNALLKYSQMLHNTISSKYQIAKN